MELMIKKETLLFGLPIEIEGLGKIYQPSLRDFIDKKLDIQRFIRAFNIKAELIFDEVPDDIKNFDIFLFQSTSNMPKEDLLINDLIESLKLLYKTDKVDLIMLNAKNLDDICISIKISNDEIYYINRNNYDDFCNVINIMLKISENIKNEEVRKELSEIELKMEKRRKEFEKKKALKNKENKKDEETITMFDLANYIIHVDNTQFNYQNVLDLTIYQLKNTFTLYRQKENYKIFMDYKTSGNFKIEENINDWFFDK